MEVIKTEFEGLLIVQPKVFKDNRGYFLETFNQKEFNEKTNLNIDFIQDNESKSKRNVLRGFHFQIGDYAQSKLVRAISGSVLDVVVDMRVDSKTFTESFSIVLNENNKTQLFVPKGFAHSFLTLSKKAIFSYKCDNYYYKEYEDGIHPFNNTFEINWPINVKDIILSEKDDQQKGFYGNFKK